MGNEAPSPYGVPPDRVPANQIVENIWIGNELTRQAIAKGAVIENPTFRGISSETSEQLKAIIPRIFSAYDQYGKKIKTYPDREYEKFKESHDRKQQEMLANFDHPDNHPRYHVAVVTTPEKIEGKKRAIFIWPGVMSSAEQDSPTAANLHWYFNEQAKANTDILPVSDVIAISSKAGMDTADQKMPRTIQESASYQAGFMLDILKKKRELGQNVPDEIIWVSHSLGCQDSIVAAEILAKLLEENGFTDTKIAGHILLQPSGFIETGFWQNLRMAKNTLTEFLPLKRAVRAKYPLPWDFTAIEKRIRKAQMSGDDVFARHLTAHRDGMLFRKDNPPDLNADEAIELQSIDSLLEKVRNPLTKSIMLKDRHALLFNALKRIAEGIRPYHWDDKKNIRGMLNYVWGAEDRLAAFHEMPSWMKLMVKKVAVLSGGGDIDDEFFAADLVEQRVPSLNEYFPLAYRGIRATVYNWSHADYPNRPHDFEKILFDLSGRLTDAVGFSEIDYFLDQETGIRADVRDLPSYHELQGRDLDSPS